jgi:ABC-2 type transport system ATP-binding protein
VISVKNLFKSFNGFQAVNDLSFDIMLGDVVGFLGPNGAGKSTTMKILTGFLLSTSGDIHISDLSFKYSAVEIKKKIGYLPEGAPAYEDMTPLQFLNFIARVRGYKGDEKAARIQRVVE